MGFLNSKVHFNVPTDPILRATRDGIDVDGTSTAAKLIVKITEAYDIKKLYVNGTLVRTCYGCESCDACDNPKARDYLRLTLDVDGTSYLMDLPPKVAARLAQLDAHLDAEGKALNELPLRLTAIAKSGKGMDWAEAVFAVADEGETSAEIKDPDVF